MGKRKKVEESVENTEDDLIAEPNDTDAMNGKGANTKSANVIAESNGNDSKVNGNGSKASEIEEEFKKLHNKAVQMGLTEEDFSKMEILKVIAWNGSYYRVTVLYSVMFILGVTLLGYSALLMYLVEWPFSRESMLNVWFGIQGLDIESEPCVIEIPESVNDFFRPPVECEFCKDMNKVEVVNDISQVEFEEKYAYTGIPVIIGDGTKNWTAPKYFSFEFFKEIYYDGSPALNNQEKHCQFFPYKTTFHGLSDVMNMTVEEATGRDGSKPWYIGWSNCDFSAANTLRKHYERPYFLPELSECSKTDWIFMGSPGYGAHLHIDNVGHPSWQAQIKGTKKWTLEPPPECYYKCPDRIEVTVQPGQIIVLDTNIWYHSTLNVGDDISITIGSEFD